MSECPIDWSILDDVTVPETVMEQQEEPSAGE
jgi:hypothetical protein